MTKYALFTCDTEFNPPWYKGTWEQQDRDGFDQGIQNIENILYEYEISGTFYCQAILVKEYPDIANRLAKKHLIGSHGYNHENYGGRPVNVYTPQQPVLLQSKEQCHELITKSIAIHKEILGIRPYAFVAPFDNIDFNLLSVLEELEFIVDSSFHNYSLGIETQLFRPLDLDLYELPLSVVRSKENGYKNVLEALTFSYSHIKDILTRDIVFITCHPYEFIDIKIPHPEHVLIVGERKIKTLRKLINDLQINGYTFLDPIKLIEKHKNNLSI